MGASIMNDGGGTTPDARMVISLEHVTLRYGASVALDDVSLDIARGERVCLLGANGSGKSTLASVICGLLAPDEGRVMLAGRRVFTTIDGPDFAAYADARRAMGLVFQNPDDQIVTSVVEEDVAFGPENLGVAPAEIGRRVNRELQRVALAPLAKADPMRLSGGQKQRVSIAGALAMEPEVLVLDEPGALLDVRGRRAVMRVIDELHANGSTIVHVTHFMDEALAADRVIVLERGRIALEGRPRDVFSKGEALAALGLELPFAAQLSLLLRARGMQIPTAGSDGELRDLLLAKASRLHLPATSSEDRRDADRTRMDREPLAIEAQDLCYSYADADGRGAVALDHLSFSVSEGASVAIVGHTGSGKSTLLRLLAALDTPDSGCLIVCQANTGRRRERRGLHGHVGYVMQHPERQLFADTVWNDVAFGPRNLGLSEDEVGRRCQRALELVGLSDRGEASPFSLSGGQQRLCAIAGVLAMEPRLLILDEPTAGLDPRGRTQLGQLLSEVHARGTTLVQVTHSMEDAARAQQVIVISEGRKLLDGSPADTFSRVHERLLHDHGLGLPFPLAFARDLEGGGMPDLGDPLALDELASSLALRLGRGE